MKALMEIYMEIYSVYVSGLWFCDFTSKEKAEKCAEKLRQERKDEHVYVEENGYYEYI